MKNYDRKREDVSSEAVGIACSQHRPEDLDLSPERRSFLGAMVGLIGACATAALGAIAGNYSIGNALTSGGAEPWIDLGSPGEIAESKPVRRTIYLSQTAGWASFKVPQVIWVMRQGERLRVFSAVCPHLGCNVNATAEGFVCPCHGSWWNLEGERLGGPTPRGLDALEQRVVANRLQIKFQRFKQGIANKEQVS